MNFVSCLGLAAALLTPGTPGGDPARRAPPVSALPASSYACVQFAGLQACRSAADEMGLLKLEQSPQNDGDSHSPVPPRPAQTPCD